jgi:hypothetical protein
MDQPIFAVNVRHLNGLERPAKYSPGIFCARRSKKTTGLLCSLAHAELPSWIFFRVLRLWL